MSLGIPVKLLHEAEGHTATVELKNNTIYRGLLTHSEDNMNCQMSKVVVKGQDGRRLFLWGRWVPLTSCCVLSMPPVVGSCMRIRLFLSLSDRFTKRHQLILLKREGRGSGTGKKKKEYTINLL